MNGEPPIPPGPLPLNWAGYVIMAIGGADGLDPALLAASDGKLAFGPQTWPHALARVMLAEQIYRAVTILAGGPYHRD